MEEKRIIDDAKNGNSESFALLYDRYYFKVYNYIRSNGARISDLDDIVQLAFLKIYKNLKYFDEEKGNIYNFMVSNCNQVIADFYKKKNSRNNIAEMVRLEDGKLSEDLVANTELDLDKYNLSSAISKLTKEQKDAFILIYVKHLKYKEAAEKLGRTESSVKSLAYRARRVLQEEIVRENPEIGKRYGFKKAIKIALISAICFALIGGFAYAMFRLYKEKIEKKTFTLSEVKKELPETDAEITRDVACEKINEYLEILGIEKKVSTDELHLNKDFYNFKECWNYKDDDFEIFVDSHTGKLVSFVCINRNELVQGTTYTEICDKLHILDGYELCEDNDENGIRRIMYAKKYGEIFNQYESVTLVVRDNKLSSLFVKDYPYEDKEIRISKDEAIEILSKERSGLINEPMLCIEKIDISEKIFIEGEYSGEKEYLKEMDLVYPQIIVKKTWRITSNDNSIFFIDVYTGELFKRENQYQIYESN